MPQVTTILTACALLLLPAAARAGECKELHDIIRQETTGAEKYVDTFSFRRDHKADDVLMLVKDSIDKGKLPKRWLLLHRDDPKSAAFCVVARGVEFGQYQNMPDNDSGDNFGAPGSGLPRCARQTQDFKPPELLRYWANRELGDSIILHAGSEDGSGYQFLISDAQDWIIIRDEKEQSCFLDRGTDLQLRFNTTLMQH